MAFRDLVKSDAVNTFTNIDEAAERLIYLPKGINPRPVNASVVRRRRSPAAEDNSRLIVEDFEITVHTDPSNFGIQSIDVAEDKFILSRYEGGGENVTTIVVEILHSDAGVWHLSLRI